MKKAAVALTVILGSATTAQADSSTTLSASPASSVVGQTVTFTARFTHYCSDGVDSAAFLVDGTAHNVVWSGDPIATSTFAISTLRVGTHHVTFQWTASQAGTSTTCQGTDSLNYIVNPRPAPAATTSPRPPPSPTHSAVPSPSPVASPASSPSPSPASPARLTGTTVADSSRSPGLPLVAGIGALLLLFVAGTLIWLRLRPRPGG